jgi:hypothetical protein
MNKFTMFVVDKKGYSVIKIQSCRETGWFLDFDVLRQGTNRKMPGAGSQSSGIPV